MNAKQYSLWTIGLTILALFIFASPTIIIDPYFHYHTSINGLHYPIDNQRYQNDGMLKHFSYNAIIAGTSMTLNFKPEEFNELFGVNSLHVSFLGGSYKEINNNIMTGLEYNPDVKIVLRGLDIDFLDKDKDYMKYDNYPEYLYDKNIFNDVNYVLNKEIFDLSWKVLSNTEDEEKKELSADFYSQYYSKEIVLSSFERTPLSDNIVEFTQEDEQRIRESIRQNVTSAAEKYPEVTFYLFWTPYNICYWDGVYREGQIEYVLEAERVAMEEMFQCANIRIFAFDNNFDLVCDLDNYCDRIHYSPAINSAILKWIKNGEYELTNDNYIEHVNSMSVFYKTYDFDAIYEQ